MKPQVASRTVAQNTRVHLGSEERGLGTVPHVLVKSWVCVSELGQALEKGKKGDLLGSLVSVLSMGMAPLLWV